MRLKTIANSLLILTAVSTPAYFTKDRFIDSIPAITKQVKQTQRDLYQHRLNQATDILDTDGDGQLSQTELAPLYEKTNSQPQPSLDQLEQFLTYDTLDRQTAAFNPNYHQP